MVSGISISGRVVAIDLCSTLCSKIVESVHDERLDSFLELRLEMLVMFRSDDPPSAE